MKNISLDVGKLPPQAIEFEEVVLGQILKTKNSLNKISGLLKSKHFYKESHRYIYSAIEKLSNNFEPINILTVTEKLKKENNLENIGGPIYISKLTNRVTSSQDIEYHVRIIIQKYISREIIRISSECASKAYDDTIDIDDVISFYEKNMNNLRLEIDKIGHVDIFKKTMDSIFEDIIEESLIKTGLDLFDKNIPLLQRMIVLLASKKKHGKTRLMIILITLILEKNNDVTVLFYAMEETVSKVLKLIVSVLTEIDSTKLLTNNLTDEEKKIVKEKLEYIKTKYSLYIKDQPESIEEIRSTFKSFCMSSKKKKKILVIDNLMMVDNDLGNQNKTDQYISKEIAKIRNQENAIIFVLHHIKKSGNQMNLDNGYRPIDEDIRGSSRIQDISNIVLALNQPGKYFDLIQEKKKLPPIVIGNKKIKRESILKSLLILEVLDSRDSRTDAEKSIIRYFANLNTMKLQEWR